VEWYTSRSNEGRWLINSFNQRDWIMNSSFINIG
jgi:hypothetical protein